MMINKKGFASQDWIIASVLFTSVIIFFVISIASVQTNYPESPNIVDEGFENDYNRLNTQLDSVTSLRNAVTSEEGLTFVGTFDVLFGSFFTMISLLFGSLDLFGSIYVNLTSDFPFIDSLVLNNLFIIGLAIITIILVFRIINAVGRNPV